MPARSTHPVLLRRHRVEAAKGITINTITNMKSKLLVPLLALVAIVGAVVAADLTYTTLPQDTDSALVLANKAATREESNKFSYISTATTTAVKSGSGVLEKIVVSTAGSSSTATIYDNTAGSGTVVGVINTDALGSYDYGGRFATGLTIVTVGTPKITVVYR